MKGEKNFRDLAEEYLADVLSPSEAEEYARLLLHNDDAVRELQAAAGRELALRNALQATAGSQARRSVRRVDPSRAGIYRWAGVAAAAALLAAGLYSAMRPTPEPVDQRSAKTPPKAPSPKPAPERPRMTEAVPEKPLAPPTAPPSDEKLRRDRESVERDLLEARDRARNNAVPSKSDPEPPPPTPPSPPSSPEPGKRPPTPAAPAGDRPAPTEAVIARIETVTGEVRLLSRGAALPATAKTDLHAGQGLETRSKASLSFTFPDGSKFDLEPGTLISQIQADSGRKILLEKGTLRGVVSKQPKDQPLVIVTPHGDAKVLGTVLRVHVDPDPKKGTKLDVIEGKVELRNLAGKKVTVDSGSTATAAAGAPLAAGFLELDGWMRNVRNPAGNTGWGEVEIGEDPLEPGRKCFRLSYPTTLQGLLLTLPERIPIAEFGGLTCDVLIPNESPRGIVLDSEVADPRENFSTTNQVTVKRGSWQPVTFKPSDYKGLAQLDGFVTRIYVCELIPGMAANAAPTHDFYLRRLQVKRITPPK